MKSVTPAIVFFIFFLYTSLTEAQFLNGFPFFKFPVSPFNIGMGSAGVSLLSDDVNGFLYNPAQLGYVSQFSNISFNMMPRQEYASGLILMNGMAFNIGYNYKKSYNIPLSIGIGFASPEIVYRDYFSNLNSYYDLKQAYQSYSIGLGIDYFLQLYLGYSYDKIKSMPEKYFSNDYGIILNIPVTDLINKNLSIPLRRDVNIIPVLNFTIGFSESISNLKFDTRLLSGYNNEIQRLGYSISAGVLTDFIPVKLFGVDFSAEGEEKDYTRSRFNGFNIMRNIIEIKGEENVIAHAGLRLSFLDIVEILNGHITYSGSYRGFTYISSGYGIRFKGLLKLSGKLTDNSILNYLGENFDIRYYNSRFSNVEEINNRYQSLELFVSYNIFD